MKFEDRIQLRLSDLTEELFENIVAYGFHAPSGMGGPRVRDLDSLKMVDLINFYGPDLNKLNYHRELVSLFPVLKSVRYKPVEVSRKCVMYKVTCAK